MQKKYLVLGDPSSLFSEVISTHTDSLGELKSIYRRIATKLETASTEITEYK